LLGVTLGLLPPRFFFVGVVFAAAAGLFFFGEGETPPIFFFFLFGVVVVVFFSFTGVALALLVVALLVLLEGLSFATSSNNSSAVVVFFFDDDFGVLLLLFCCVDFCGVVCRDERRVGVAIIYTLFSLSENALVEKLFVRAVEYIFTTTTQHQLHQLMDDARRECEEETEVFSSFFLNFFENVSKP
jgi:hypothetical protein